MTNDKTALGVKKLGIYTSLLMQLITAFPKLTPKLLICVYLYSLQGTDCSLVQKCNRNPLS